MMRCLQYGGMELVYRRKDDEKTHKKEQKMNPYGFFEGAIFPVEGKVIKKFPSGFRTMIQDGMTYKVCFMTRSLEAVRASNAKVLKPTLDRWMVEIDKEIEKINSRPDTDVTVISFEGMFADPKKELQKLVDSYWPIDIDKAVLAIDKTLRHF